MQDKKIIILIVLSIIAIASLTYGITASRRGSYAPIISQESAQRSEMPPQSSVSSVRRPRKSNFASWGRDPFAPEKTSASAVPFILNGIILDKKEPKAIINNEIVGIGDKIGDAVIIDIKKNAVILNDGIADFELNLESME
jgi:hypothetical protein